MDSSTGKHQQQEMCSQTLESILSCTKSSQQEKKPRPSDMQVIKCPRCDSTNTKFCYYNNYSLSQPRYFCKSCRRYWTKGGTLRNVPVGGGCRKNKRSSSSSSSSSPSSKTSQSQPFTTIPIPIPSYDSSDLSLAIARLQKQSNSGQVFGLNDDHDHFSTWGNLNLPHHNHGDLGMIDSPFDALRMNGFFENPPNGNLYYGMGNVMNMEMENGGGFGMCGAQGMGISFEDFTGGTTSSTAVTTVKQEVRNGGRDDESRLLRGYPWVGAGGGDGNGADFNFDSNRSMSWNGMNGSYNWHGLLNNPLM
ncbi:hypothetical protein OROGR_024510 [Orobanche gracilis]